MIKLKKIGSILFFVLAFGVFFIFNSHEVTGAGKQSVTVAKVKNAPAGLDDPAWQKAKAVDVHKVGGIPVLLPVGRNTWSCEASSNAGALSRR